MNVRFKNWLLILLIFPEVVIGQNSDSNLVSNSGFEAYFDCPVHLNHNVFAGDTILPSRLSPTNGSVDYYNACSNSFKSDTGDNWISYLQPHSGNGCIGMLLNDEVREYVQTKLKSTLRAGHRYRLTFYVKRATKTNYASDAVDFYVSREPTMIDDYENLIVKPTGLKSLGTNDDWQLVEIEFTASGGEQYLTLGNTASWHKHIYIDSKVKKKYNLCYYFIDDVKLIELKSHAHIVDKLNNAYYQTGFTNLVWNGGFESINIYAPPLSPYNQFPNAAIGPFWYSSGAASADFIYNPIGIDAIYYGILEQDIFSRRIYRNMPYLGRGMGGIIPYQTKSDTLEDYYEYLIGTLKEPLQANKKYEISFMVRSAPYTAFAVNRIGLMFSDTFPSKEGYYKIERQADIDLGREAELGSEEGWVEVKGTYYAKGGESYVVIGAIDEKPVSYFDNQIDQRYATRGSKNYRWPYPYYFVDEVIVQEEILINETRVPKNPKSVAILIDASLSMNETGYLEKIKESIREMTLYMSQDDRISIVIFGSKSEILLENTSAKNLAAIESKISEISLKGKSPYAKGLNLVRQVIQKENDENASNYVVIFTDGDYSHNNTNRHYDHFTNKGVRLFPVLVGSSISNQEQFTEAASRTNGKVMVPKSDDLVLSLLSIFSGND